jgi:hypothetical protein
MTVAIACTAIRLTKADALHADPRRFRKHRPVIAAPNARRRQPDGEQ